jgi:hypothetical protein
MKPYHLRGVIFVLFSVSLLISCGNGGGGGMTAGGGIGGSGIISQGAVSAFGSIVVNGTEFDTSNAAIIVNGVEIGVGDEIVQDNLDVGRVVTVEGRINTDESAVADRVVYSTNVNGPVESVNATDPITNEKEIVVLGQTVVVNFITKFKPDTIGFDTIAEDDVIEVSGYRDFDGKIRATFIEKTGEFISGSIVEVTGLIKNLNSSLETFEINGLTVNYALIANDLPEGIPADDLFVEVQGTLDTPEGEMIANEIELGDELDGEDGDEFEIMGFVTEIISDLNIIKFKVGNQVVHVDPDSAVFVDGFPDDIAAGQKLEAEGSLEGGTLFAWEIEFWKPDQIEVEGIVDWVVFIDDFPEFTFEEREDQRFQTNKETEFEDVKPDEIEAGMALEVKGVPQDIEQSVVKADKVSFEIE